MKIPKQEYTAEVKELAVKRVKDGMTAGAAAKELGLVDQTLRNWVKAAAARHAQRCWSQGGHTGTDGNVKTASREHATETRERNHKKWTLGSSGVCNSCLKNSHRGLKPQRLPWTLVQA